MRSGTLRVNKDVEMDGHGIYLLLDKIERRAVDRYDGAPGDVLTDWRVLIVESDAGVDPPEGSVEWMDERWLLEWTRPYLQEDPAAPGSLKR